jgi:hypothetical protein
MLAYRKCAAVAVLSGETCACGADIVVNVYEAKYSQEKWVINKQVPLQT